MVYNFYFIRKILPIMKTENEKKKYTVPTILVVVLSHSANLLDASAEDQDYDGEFGLLGNDSNSRIS